MSSNRITPLTFLFPIQPAGSQYALVCCLCWNFTVPLTIMASIDVDAFTKPFQLTKSMHRDLYASLELSNPALNASGKVVLITGAGGKVGGVSNARSILPFSAQIYSRSSFRVTNEQPRIGHCVRMGHSGRGRDHSRRPWIGRFEEDGREN